MKTGSEVQVGLKMETEEGELQAAEPVMLVHLQQKLDFVRKGLALAFTRVEVEYLQRAIQERAKALSA